MNEMLSAVRSVISNYATFSGRASRSEFWWWVLACFIALLLLSLVDGLIIGPMLGFGPGDKHAGHPLSLIFSVVTLLPTIAVGARRLHDIGRTALWLLIAFLPLIGALVLLWLTAQPSAEANEWGHPAS